MNTRIKQFILLGGDVVVLYSSLYFTFWARYQELPSSSLWQSHFWIFSFVFLAWIIIFYIVGLYSLNLAVNNVRFFQLIINTLALAAVFALAFFYIYPQTRITPKTNLVIFLVIFALLFLFWRRFFNWSLKSYLPKRNIAIIGLNHQAEGLIAEIKASPHLGYKIGFILDLEKEEPRIKNLKAECLRSKINTIVLASDVRESSDLRSALFDCLPLNIRYISLANFYENLTGKVPVSSIDKIWFFENLNQKEKKMFDRNKQILDFIFAFLILVFSLPFWLIIALLIKISSKGPIFFIQARMGENEKIFKLIKFRTMRIDAEANGPQWAKNNDPRITWAGKFLRNTRLDEIPQVLNILRGDMSLIGPRPERPEFIAQLKQEIPFYNERHLVKPGLTGWAQINYPYGSSEEDALKKLQYDLFYIKNRSIYLDISILLKTIATVLSRAGR